MRDASCMQDEDKRLFGNAELRRGRLGLTNEQYVTPNGDVIVLAHTEKGERIEVLFSGSREETFRRTLDPDLRRAYINRIDQGSWDLDAVSVNIDVQGVFQKTGVEDPRWRLVAAFWRRPNQNSGGTRGHRRRR